MEFGYWEENFHEWDLFTKNGVTNNAEADVFFNFDRFAGTGGYSWIYPPFESKIVEETATTKIVQNSDGLLAEIPKDGHDTIPHFIGPPSGRPTTGRR